MKLSFYGAAKEVTGSCYHIETNGTRFLIDCGMQQGDDEKKDNRQKLLFDASDINFVVLTHAHIDHSGRLPLLVKEGFKGRIYAIKATCDLISIMLKDSANIQEMDAKQENRKGKRAGRNKVKPLYTMADVENTLKLLVPCTYREIMELGNGINVNFMDAGHILGSASAEIFLTEGDVSKKIVFSGDIGNINQPIVKDPEYPEVADYVVMEATYGDREHEETEDYISGLARIINETINRGGNVIIPAFAVGRTQGLLYLIREIKEKKLTANPLFPVYVDSPLASEATDLYDNDLDIYGDTQTKNIISRGLHPFAFPGLSFTDSVDDSKALNYDSTPKVIISSSGMCEGGRIRHHLKHNLWRKECSVVFVGYQAPGTLGRALLDGADRVTIFGEEIAVMADVENFTGLSAHSDKSGLIKWISSFNKKPDKVFVTHVEDSVSIKFVNYLKELGYSAVAPLFTSVYDLISGEAIFPGIDISEQKPEIKDVKTLSGGYADLISAYEQLSGIIKNAEGFSDKEMKRLTQEIKRIIKN